MEKEVFLNYLYQNQNLDEESLGALQQLTREHPWFQAGWMLYLKNLKELNASEFEKVLKKVALMVPDRKQLYRFLNNELVLNTAKEYKLPGTNAADGNSLIDKFLHTDPGTIRPKNNETHTIEATDNKHIIEKSVSEDDALITETLANIYFQQKNYEKAMEAYKKLSLKYPEKSIYFASRIKEIEELKHNN